MHLQKILRKGLSDLFNDRNHLEIEINEDESINTGMNFIRNKFNKSISLLEDSKKEEFEFKDY